MTQTLNNAEPPKGALAIDVLDHGYVILHNVAGPTRRAYNAIGDDFGSIELRRFDADDTDPANTARTSFGEMNSDRTREQDLKLAEYLMEHKHTTPFEMIDVWLEMKLPIFVARQFVRHRTCSINEISGRYVTLPDEWYIPVYVGGKPKNVKQGQEDSLPGDLQNLFKMDLDDTCRESYNKYLFHLRAGVAPEHARMLLHLNHYTKWIWKQDIHNIMHFLSLRADSHAQVEAQAYADAIIGLLRQVLPATMDLFDKYRRL